MEKRGQKKKTNWEIFCFIKKLSETLLAYSLKEKKRKEGKRKEKGRKKERRKEVILLMMPK